MKALRGLQTRIRIFIDEQDKYKSKPLYRAIIEMMQEEKLAGATVFRGMAGFGAKSHWHSERLLALSHNLPIVIECVDTRETIDRIMPKIDAMMSDGLVTLETVEVVRYAPKP